MTNAKAEVKLSNGEMVLIIERSAFNFENVMELIMSDLRGVTEISGWGSIIIAITE